jgi:hypothetical protein
VLASHSALLEIAQQRLAALGALLVNVLDREELLSPSGRAPIITRVQNWLSSNRMLKYTPNPQGD